MRIPAIVGLVFLASCGSAGLSGQQGEQLVNLQPGGNAALRMAGSDAPHFETVKAPVETVFRLLPTILDSLGITVTDLDPSRHFIGNSALKVRRQLGGTILSKYIDCGSAQGFPSAETYDVQLSLRTQLNDLPGGQTAISTVVEAVGRPAAFAGEYVRCSSKGTLEKAVLDAVNARTH